MAKTKDKTKESGSKKRKADASATEGSSSKKARHASPVVELPHTPGGTVPTRETKTVVKGDATPTEHRPEPTNVSDAGEDQPKRAKKGKKRAPLTEDTTAPTPPTLPEEASKVATRGFVMDAERRAAYLEKRALRKQTKRQWAIEAKEAGSAVKAEVPALGSDEEDEADAERKQRDAERKAAWFAKKAVRKQEKKERKARAKLEAAGSAVKDEEVVKTAPEIEASSSDDEGDEAEVAGAPPIGDRKAAWLAKKALRKQERKERKAKAKAAGNAVQDKAEAVPGSAMDSDVADTTAGKTASNDEPAAASFWMQDPERKAAVLEKRALRKQAKRERKAKALENAAALGEAAVKAPKVVASGSDDEEDDAAISDGMEKKAPKKREMREEREDAAKIEATSKAEADRKAAGAAKHAAYLAERARRRRAGQERKARELGGAVDAGVEGGDAGVGRAEDEAVAGAVKGSKKRKSKKKKHEGEVHEVEAEAEAPADTAIALVEPEQEGHEAGEDSKPAQARKQKERKLKARKLKKPLSADDAEALGSKELDREVSMLDVDALEEQAAAEAEAKGVAKRSDDTPPNWIMLPPSGGRYIEHDPIFATDPSTKAPVLIAATQRDVQVLSIETSLPLRTHALAPGLSVLSFSQDARHPQQLHVACDNGAGFVWDWTVEDAEPRVSRVADAKFVAAARWDKGEQGMVYLKDIGERTAIWADKLMFKAGKSLKGVNTLGDGEYIVAWGTHTLVVGQRKAPREYTWVEVPINTAVTCTDTRLSNTQDKAKRRQLSLALGHVSGRIHFYDDITPLFTHPSIPQQQPSLPSPRILHWHRTSLPAVKFSRDGGYLVSGGSETVLVLWQLSTGKKQFLPHLTSEIERIVISPAGDRYAVQMGDNSIMVLSTSELKPVANFAGLQIALPVPGLKKKHRYEQKAVAAVLHPQTSEQLLLAVPASQPRVKGEAEQARPFLQTFDLRASRHVTRQALTRNNVTDFSQGPEYNPIAAPDVVLLAISHDGAWMATVDVWMPPAKDVAYLASSRQGAEEERRKRREVYLKIWSWDEGKGVWTLSTRVDAPHARAGGQTQGAGMVGALVVDPVGVGFATVGEDGRVRIWRPRTRGRHGAKEVEGDVVEWVCKRTVELPAVGDGRADSPLGSAADAAKGLKACLAYSEDGSMLAAGQSSADEAAASVVHLIDTATGTIKATHHDIAAAQLAHLVFLDRYLIAVSPREIHVWDLVTNTLQHRHGFSYKGDGAPLLAVDSADGTFAVAAGKTVRVYKPQEGGGAAHQEDCRQHVESVLAARGSKGYTLLFEDATVRKLSCVGALKRRELRTATGPADVESPQAIEDAPALDEDVEMPDVLALPAVGATSRGPVFEETEDDRPVVRPEQLAQIFDVAQSFAMPPVREMFASVVGLFGRKPLARVAVAA